MAQVGDTITYTYSNGNSVSEDVSDVDEVVVEYCDGGGGGEGVGFSAGAQGGSGGRVENVTIDVSNVSTIYIWVGKAGGSPSAGLGRYDGGAGSGPNYPSGGGGASSEISLSNTNQSNSSAEPFFVGAGGGGGGGADTGTGGGGGRGGTGFGGGKGVAPPAGGDGSADETTPGGDGDGAIASKSKVTGGTTTKGGGSAPGNDGEVKLSFNSVLSPPDPPSNLTAEVQ